MKTTELLKNLDNLKEFGITYKVPSKYPTVIYIFQDDNHDAMPIAQIILDETYALTTLPVGVHPAKSILFDYLVEYASTPLALRGETSLESLC